MSSVTIVRAGERFHTRIDWLDSWHSFSFGQHYDPKNTHHGLLLVHNDDVITPGAGFGSVNGGWFIITVCALLSDARVSTDPSSRQKFRPSSE